jgi:hypothetical protein
VYVFIYIYIYIYIYDTNKHVHQHMINIYRDLGGATPVGERQLAWNVAGGRLGLGGLAAVILLLAVIIFACS